MTHQGCVSPGEGGHGDVLAGGKEDLIHTQGRPNEQTRRYGDGEGTRDVPVGAGVSE